MEGRILLGAKTSQTQRGAERERVREREKEREMVKERLTEHEREKGSEREREREKENWHDYAFRRPVLVCGLAVIYSTAAIPFQGIMDMHVGNKGLASCKYKYA